MTKSRVWPEWSGVEWDVVSWEQDAGQLLEDQRQRWGLKVKVSLTGTTPLRTTFLSFPLHGELLRSQGFHSASILC